MKSDINDLCEAFLAALTNAGYAVKSIENYKQVSNRFKKFCAENGYDTYTVNIGQIFADNVFNEETGAFVGYRNVMYGRFVRLINSFYLQGTFDFSMVTKEKNLPKSIHLIEIYQDYMEHLKTQYSNIGTIGFFQNGMLHLLRYMEDGGILTLKDLAVSDVVNYICSWSQKHQRNVLCILRNIFRHFGREDLYFAVAGIHPYRTKRIVPMFTDNEIMSIEEVLSSPSVSHRDAAIFFLGLTTGMRAVDVVDLRLANIDWDNETIFFQQSKTGNAVCLPLTVDIGNSIYRYILEERPRVDDDHVFLRSQAPFIPLGGHSTCYYTLAELSIDCLQNIALALCSVKVVVDLSDTRISKSLCSIQVVNTSLRADIYCPGFLARHLNVYASKYVNHTLETREVNLKAPVNRNSEISM